SRMERRELKARLQMNIKFEEGIFYVGDRDHPDAELTYQRKDAQTSIADHTFVDEKLRGEGVAGKLFNELIAFARKEQLQIIPDCSYVKKETARTAEYDDVL